MMAFASVVDKKRLKRLEQQSRRTIDARCAVALLANDTSQFLENEIGAGNFIAAQHGAFELADQQRSRAR